MLTAAPDPDFADLLQRDVLPPPEFELVPPPAEWLATLATWLRHEAAGPDGNLARRIESLVGILDLTIAEQINVILHAPEFQALEASWRGLWILVRSRDDEPEAKVKIYNISKRELGRTMRKFRGDAWDQSPIFKRVYEDEYGQFGGEPFALLLGDYAFDHRPDDVALLADMARVAAAAHAPFIASAAPSLLLMDSWSEIANPRDLKRIFTTPEFIAWRSLREQEDTRYVGLCMPRFLARLPYGAATDPLDEFAFEEHTDGPDQSKLLWGNPAFAFVANAMRAFVEFGWCVRIRGIDRGGVVHDLPVLHHPTADGDTDRRTVSEICLSAWREAELASCGLIPLVHVPNSEVAAFFSAQSLQKPAVYDDPDATANATLSARLPYLLASCRFAHYLKCMVRDKIGASMTREQLQAWLADWLLGYVDGSPASSSEEFKAAHPLADADVELTEREDAPGMYDARFHLQPHYQLEGLSVALRLVSRMASA